MIIGKTFKSPDNSDSASQTIDRLDLMLDQFILEKSSITANMAKGFLDYHGISKEAWKWRFEKMYNENGDVHTENVDEAFSIAKEEMVKRSKAQFACQQVTPEEYFGFAWQTIAVVRDKVDEFLDDITGRKYSVGITSVPYKSLESIIQYKINNKMSKPESKQALDNALFMAATKGVGFLRPTMYDIKKTSYIPTFGSKGIESRDKWKEVETNDKAGVIVESIDPERVFVDIAADKPKDLFIVTPLDPSELVYRFPKLKNRISEYSDKPLVDQSIGQREGCIRKTSRFCYHAGEMIKELYDAGSLDADRFGNLFRRDGILQGMNNNIIFDTGRGGFFWDSYIYNRLSEEKKSYGYFLIEYYDLANDLYCAYIDDMILDKGYIPSTYKGMPIVPIRLENKAQNFFSQAITEYFAIFQDQQTSINMKQRINEIVQGTNIILVDTDQLDESKHRDRQIEFAQFQPIQSIYVKDMMADTVARPPVVQPVSFNNGADTVLQNRQAYLNSVQERQFPSLKSLIASNQREVQQQMIYSRDAKTNTFLRNVTISLSHFAVVLFHQILMEMRHFNVEYSDTSIPLYKGSKEKATLYIATDEDHIKEARRSFALELETLYTSSINAFITQALEKEEVINPIMQQIQKEIEDTIVKQTLSLAEIQPQSEEDYQVKREAILSDPNTGKVVGEQMARQGINIAKARLAEMAKQQIPMPQDSRVYISFGDLANYEQLIEDIHFDFDKSQIERQNEILSIINTIAPFVQSAQFTIKVEELMKEILLANNQNPSDWLVEKPPTQAKIVETLNTRFNTFFDLMKNPKITADFLNEQKGENIYTPEMLVQAMALQESAVADIEIRKIQARGDIKVAGDVNKTTLTKEADFRIEQAKQQLQTPSAQE